MITGIRVGKRRLSSALELAIPQRKCNAKGVCHEDRYDSIASLRFEPELRRAAESVLHNGEILSSFVE